MSKPTQPSQQAQEIAAATSPEQLYQHSMKMINEAIASCGIEGMEGVELPPLHVAQPVTQNDFAPSQASGQKTDFYALAKQLYSEQESLFEQQLEHDEQVLQGHGQADVDPGLAASLQPPQQQQPPFPGPPQQQPHGQQGLVPPQGQEPPMDESLQAIHDMFNNG